MSGVHYATNLQQSRVENSLRPVGEIVVYTVAPRKQCGTSNLTTYGKALNPPPAPSFPDCSEATNPLAAVNEFFDTKQRHTAGCGTRVSACRAPGATLRLFFLIPPPADILLALAGEPDLGLMHREHDYKTRLRCRRWASDCARVVPCVTP